MPKLFIVSWWDQIQTYSNLWPKFLNLNIFQFIFFFWKVTYSKIFTEKVFIFKFWLSHHCSANNQFQFRLDIFDKFGPIGDPENFSIYTNGNLSVFKIQSLKNLSKQIWSKKFMMWIIIKVQKLWLRILEII